MDSTTYKFYHIHGMDCRNYMDLYFSNKEDMIFGDDSLKFPMAHFHYQLSSGRIVGTILMDISVGSVLHQLFSASNYFKEILVLKFNEKCIMELTRWLHDRTGAFDWTHASSAAVELEGKRDQFHEKEMQLRSSIKQILKCDFKRENITAPVDLPLADCIISMFLLESISKNEDEYMKNLEKILKLLKPGGKLLLVGSLETTHVTVGKERLHRLKLNELGVKNALCKLGLVVDYCAVQKRRNVSDLTDYGAAIFIVACKGK
ncbi:indolethylamine N-methyltransferase-like [Pyxicephalus adspersus]|uniref:indolethylamine N-methyltransferase-like n=1 Tax=Pyxicephalus adspersus TaxID=30357 RepID=UPI003B5BA0B3